MNILDIIGGLAFACFVGSIICFVGAFVDEYFVCYEVDTFWWIPKRSSKTLKESIKEAWYIFLLLKPQYTIPIMIISFLLSIWVHYIKN